MRQNTKFFSSRLLIGLCLVLVCQSAGCNSMEAVSPDQEAHYRLILSEAPCLDAICPGMVGRDLLTEQLWRSPLIEAVYDNGGSPVNFTLRNPNPEAKAADSLGGGALRFASDSQGKFETLESVFINMPGLTLATVIEVLGIPEEYFLVSGCGMGNQTFGLILYPSLGVYTVLSFETRQPNLDSLYPTTLVTPIYTTVQGFEASLIQNITTNVLESVAFDLVPQIDVTYLRSEIRPWPTDGSYPSPTINLCSR